jgi:glycosyltransferase involved in cell wall biosynthesis
MISFVVPAHNEQACLGRTLQAIHDAACAIGKPYEVIVVDDASTDATADVGRIAGAIVVPVNVPVAEIAKSLNLSKQTVYSFLKSN